MYGCNTTPLLGWPIFRGYVSLPEGRCYGDFFPTCFFCEKPYPGPDIFNFLSQLDWTWVNALIQPHNFVLLPCWSIGWRLKSWRDTCENLRGITRQIDIYKYELESPKVAIWLSQWPTFKLLGITYFVGTISRLNFKLLFQGPLVEYSHILKAQMRPIFQSHGSHLGRKYLFTFCFILGIPFVKSKA